MENDLISRSALLAELYEARRPPDHYSEQVYEKYRVWRNGVEFAIQKIKAAPTVDAVPVVRCGECKHIENSPYGRYCTVWHGHNGMGDEGYCNYGERKTE